MIEVVCGVIVRNQRVMLTQRRFDDSYAFCWESPGGETDGNESHHGTVTRELGEELGAEVDAIPENCLWCGHSDPNTFVLFYPVLLKDECEPKPLEGQGMGWFNEQELRVLTLTPANRLAIEQIVAYMRTGPESYRPW